MKRVRSPGQRLHSPKPPAWPGPMGVSWAGWLGALGIGLLFVLLRWNNYDAPLLRDEGEYAYSAWLLRHGLPPYTFSFLQKPPMVVYSYALCQLVAPHVYWAPRVLAGLFAALATGLVGFIARLEFGREYALPAMWLFTPMVLLPGVEQFPANTEMFMLLPLVGTAAVCVFGRVRGCGAGGWWGAGFLGAVTLFYKYTALPPLLLLYGAWSYHEWRLHKSPWRLGSRWLFSLCGALVADLAGLAFFLIHDGGRHLWECSIAFNRYYATLDIFGFAALWHRLKLFFPDWWVLFLLPATLAFCRAGRVWLWLGILVVAFLTCGATVYGHYYITIMPFWAIVAAVAILRLATWAAGRFASPERGLRCGAYAVVLLLICLPDLSWMLCSKEEFAVRKLGGFPFLQSGVVAKRVAELTSPQDYVLVAGSEPQILYYAERFSPTRFVIAYPLMIPTPLARTFQHEAMGDLERHPPAVIVFTREHTSWLEQEGSPPEFAHYLTKLLTERYEQVGGYVGDGASGQWQEPLAPQDFANSQLVVFKRRAP